MKIEISDLSPEVIDQIYSKYQSSNNHTQGTLLSIINNESELEEIKSKLGSLIGDITKDGADVLRIISDEKKRLKNEQRRI